MLILFKKKKIVQILQNLWTSYDPYWDNVVLHMPMDTAVVDTKGHSIISNTTSMSSATKKFGTTAIALNGSQGVTIGARSDLGITGDFTFEGWVRFSTISTNWTTTTPSNQYIFDFGTNGTHFGWNAPNGWAFNNASVIASSTPSIAIPVVDTWYHWAVCRSGSTLRIFINGTVVASTTYTNAIGSASTPITLGNYGGGGNYGVQGFIDDVRLTNGIARYKTSFTPPTAAFPVGALELDFDPYWDQTVLSLHGGQNDKYDATFADSSNTMIVTKHGFVSQGVSSPFSGIPNSGSIRLINGIDYISVPYSSNINFQGDFTVECWFKFDTATFWQYICGKGSYGANHDFSLILTSATTITTYSNGAATNLQVTVPTMQPNTWYHVAFVRASGVNKIYLNGISYGSNTMSISNSNTTDPFVIGRQTSNNSTAALTGNISNFRITKNAVYTSNFTPSSTPLALVSSTVLLLNCENTGAFNNNHSFVDSSTNNLTITRTGNVSQGSFSPFANVGGSAYFDGNGDYLSAPSNNGFALGVDDFTIETWINFSSSAAGQQPLSGYQNDAVNWCLYTVGNNLTLYLSSNGVTWNIASGVVIMPVTVGIWKHVAVVKTGTTVRAYVDGTLTATISGVSSIYSNNNPVYVGAMPTGYAFTGYISNFRIVKGTAVYTNNFTVPTAPLTAVTNTSLLLKFENAGTIDATRNNVLETVGDVVSGAQKKFGNTALYFDGAGNKYVRIPDSANFALGSAFTIEFYMYATAGANAGGKYNSPIGQRPGDTVHSWYCHVGHDASIGFCGPAFEYRGTNGAIAVTALSSNSAHLTPLNTWVHIAITYDGTTIRTFQNGAIVAQAAYTGSIGDVTSPLTIGGLQGTSEWFSGYIDDIRITKGIARYQTNFSPRTRNQTSDVGTTTYDPYWDKVVLRMPMDGDDNGTVFTELTGKTVTRYGNTVTTAVVKKYGTTSAYFDGTSSTYLSCTGALEDFTSNDFTVECWVNFSDTGVQRAILHANTNAAGGLHIHRSSSGYLSVDNGLTATTSGTIAIPANQWVHIAIVRSSSVIYGYVNGVRCLSHTAQTYTVPSQVQIGRYHAGATIGNMFGYMSDFRLTKGVARYNKNFTPPTQALPVSDYVWVSGDKYDPYWNNVVLHMPMDSMVDVKGHSVSTSGGATLASDAKFGSNCFQSPYPSNGHLIISGSSDFSFPKEFTVEFWVKFSNSAPFNSIISIGTYADGILLRNNSTDNFYVNNSIITGAGSFVPYDSQWHHVAITRDFRNNVRLFLDGTLKISATVSGTINSTSGSVMIGVSSHATTTEGMFGYIDDLRITKGKARYTQNFTIPTEAHPTVGASS